MNYDCHDTLGPANLHQTWGTYWSGTGTQQHRPASPVSSCELHTTAIGGTNHSVILVKVEDIALNEVGQIAILITSATSVDSCLADQKGSLAQ